MVDILELARGAKHHDEYGNYRSDYDEGYDDGYVYGFADGHILASEKAYLEGLKDGKRDVYGVLEYNMLSPR